MALNLAIALLLIPAWAYLVGAAVAVCRFTQRPSHATPPLARRRSAALGRRSTEGQMSKRPPVSVLKPLHGDEPGLYENLRSFAEQDYPTMQIVLGVNDPEDNALPAARAVICDLPTRDIALVVDRRARGSNAKVANLENMLEAARHNVVVLADSDMRVDQNYLATVTAPLLDPQKTQILFIAIRCHRLYHDGVGDRHRRLTRQVTG